MIDENLEYRIQESLKFVSFSMPPKISVIIPVFNGEGSIEEAINSIIVQEYPNLEIIVVDDGSTDGTAELVKNYASINYFYQQKQGPASARNTGIKKSRGEYITFLDADDLYPSNKLWKQIYYINQNPSCLVVRFLIKYEYLIPYKGQLQPFYINEKERTGFNCNLGSFLFNRQVFDNFGSFNESLFLGEDLDFIYRLIEQGIIIHEEKEVGLVYRINENSISLDEKKRKKSMVKVLYERRKRLAKNASSYKGKLI